MRHFDTPNNEVSIHIHQSLSVEVMGGHSLRDATCQRRGRAISSLASTARCRLRFYCDQPCGVSQTTFARHVSYSRYWNLERYLLCHPRFTPISNNSLLPNKHAKFMMAGTPEVRRCLVVRMRRSCPFTHAGSSGRKVRLIRTASYADLNGHRKLHHHTALKTKPHLRRIPSHRLIQRLELSHQSRR